jgi:lon-related putative ATP-dependent protease
MNKHPRELAPEQLRCDCDPSSFHFNSTADIAPLKGFVAQERPVRAIRFGLDIHSPGYNIYVSGLTGTGKNTVIRKFLEEIAVTMPTPDDWCYVHNFRDPNSPVAIHLPAGRAKHLSAEMDELVTQLKREIPKAFDSKEYEQSMNGLIAENQAQQQGLFNQLSEKARQEGFALEMSKMGVSLVPILNGKPIPPEQYEALEDETKQEMEKRRTALQSDINNFLREVREVNKASREKVNELNRRVGLYVVGARVEEIKEQYSDIPQVVSYLEDVQDHVLSHLEDFSEKSQEADSSPAAQLKLESQAEPYLKYRVNIVVDNTDTRGAPVIIETNPTYYNLFGRVERRTQLGSFFTDFTMVRAGSYARANGGYLVVTARDVLMNVGVWETLKRTIRDKAVRMEDLGEQYGLIPVAAMRPSPIPVDVKVIMIGNQWIYQALYGTDEDFRKIFKVKADFDYEMQRNEEALQGYAMFISDRCHVEGLVHFDPSGVAEVVEYGARLVDDQERLSARFSDLADIVREASYWAREEGAAAVSASHVMRAEAEKYFRSNLIEVRLREFITRGIIMVDVAGEKIGQVNGLSVIDLGDIRFGKPSRITAKTYVGRSGVLDIEREAKMSGKIYEKGVLILSGYLSGKYAQERPLSMSASLCFEQSYEGVEGDSASSTEVYALLSSLSGVPIRQGIAVTGSVNQHGEIQPIGGVNQKIEGYYDVCKAFGLTVEQGVLIPVQNIKNLMLRYDVIDAVKAGQFHIYAVGSVDEGIELLTGIPAGERVDGGYPEGTIHHLVEKRLKEFAERLKKLDKTGEEEKPGKSASKDS